jgi:Ca2+-binding RTX toxin-like protein
MARVREIDLDLTLDEPAAPLARARAAAPVAEIPTAEAPVGTAAGPLNPALDDIVVDMSGGVFVPVPPNRVIHGTKGDDVLYGGAGNDVMRGLAGDDVIFGGAGNDSISGDAGRDLIFGGIGNDHINGNAGDDILHGDAGNDSLWGADGNDVLKAGDGDDRLEGAAGTDKLYGGNGNDTLRGGDGDDTISGNAGSDRIDGGKGLDRLTGGEGRDFFIADLNVDEWPEIQGGHHPHAHHDPDIVTDFQTAGPDRDCIDLRMIMAKTLFTGTTLQQAVDEGFLYLTGYSYTDADGNSGFGAKVHVSYDGWNGNDPTKGQITVLDLQSVNVDDLSFSSYAGHFLL